MLLILILSITVGLLSVLVFVESKRFNKEINYWRQAALDLNAEIRQNS